MRSGSARAADWDIGGEPVERMSFNDAIVVVSTIDCAGRPHTVTARAAAAVPVSVTAAPV